MPLPPFTTPAPQPIFLPAMSSINAAPTPSPLPVQRKRSDGAESDASPAGPDETGEKKPAADFALPKLRLHIQDITHKGATVFLAAVEPATLLPSSVRTVLAHLYQTPARPDTHVPSTRSVTLILRPMDGVAYTHGLDLDDDHKEIHFNLNYVAAQPLSRRAHEISGVVVHELVHCFQYNGRGACPGGLIEGIADWVRLQAGLAPPHWKRPAPKDVGGANGKGGGGGWDGPDRWDAGYQHTAYFLDYLEGRFGSGTVRSVNEKLRTQRYEAKPFWTELVGRPVEQLWDDYKEAARHGNMKNGSEDLVTDEESSVEGAQT
ncbi:plant basic secretory protein [Xylariaceae sp. FL0016]|nr:plant basic secretory protein [Xylariaceae sp. FL0016]